MKLSVTIPTYNRSALLQKALESIQKQTFSQSDFEVLIVDNGSKDDTNEIVKSFSDKIQNLYYFYQPVQGLHACRHTGLKESKSDILVFVDDDIEAFPTWLEGIWESFDDEKVKMVGGKNIPLFEKDPPFWLWAEWNKPFKLGKVLFQLSILDFGDDAFEFDPHYIFGCNFSIRKDILLDAGGFHPDSMPQDLIRFRGDGETHVSRYVKSNNLKALYNPKASVYHVVSSERMTQEYFLKRQFNQGVSDSYTHLRNRAIKPLPVKSKLSKYFRIILGIESYHQNKQIIRDLNTPAFFKEMSYYYQEGYNYHQSCYNNYVEVRNWVHKDNYF